MPEGLIGIGILLVVFLAFREVVCWYWKINELVGYAKRSTEALEKIAASVDDGQE